MPIWQRLLITLAAMFGASLIAGWLWSWLFGYTLPSYAAGVIGGLAALPVWELLRRISPREPEPPPREM